MLGSWVTYLTGLPLECMMISLVVDSDHVPGLESEPSSLSLEFIDSFGL